jgi:hypothetical protein
MSPAIIRAAIRAEIRRAQRAGRAIDRRYLKHETGLDSINLEWRISQQFVGDGLPPDAPAKGSGGAAIACQRRPSAPLVKRWRKG